MESQKSMNIEEDKVYKACINRDQEKYKYVVCTDMNAQFYRPNHIICFLLCKKAMKSSFHTWLSFTIIIEKRWIELGIQQPQGQTKGTLLGR